MKQKQSALFLQIGIGLSLLLLALAACSATSSPTVSPVPPHTTTAPAPTSQTLLHPTQQLDPTSAETETAPPATASATSPAPTATSPSPTASAPPAAPQPSPTPSPSPAPTTLPEPQILSFTIAPTTTQNIGDQIFMAWEALGQGAAICPLLGSGPVEAECQDVPLQGDSTFTTDESSMAYLGFALRVTGADTKAWSAVYTHLQCQDLRAWFFDHPPERCPAAPALHSYAAGQYFEHGFMVWVEDTDEFYIFYQGPDQAGFQTFERLVGLQLKPGASQDNRVPDDPPPGYLQPVSGFGLLWRGEVDNLSTDVRQRLGWATAPEFGFDTAYQCATRAHPRSWSCYLRGPSGELLHLHPDSTAQVRLLWQEE
ncbi:MAG: hypothetical protein PVI80_09540 [Anaerolineae bacterium]